MSNPGVKNGTNPAGKEGGHHSIQPGGKEYFRRLRRRLRVALFVSYLVPLAILSLYFHFQFNITMRESSKLHLTILAESQRNTINQFLQERVVNIFSLYHSRGFNLSPAPDEMRMYLQSLREMSDSFLDVGFLDQNGVQIGYAGPYSFLQGKDYSHEPWFTDLMTRDNNYLITDIYMGFRNKPHFTIAVKQIFDAKPFVMRATLDPDKFYIYMRNIARGKQVDSALISRDGKFQVVDPDQGDLLGPSDYPLALFTGPSGALEIRGESTVLVAYSWLEEAPWALVVRQPLTLAYEKMYQARNIIIVSTVVIVVLLFMVIMLTTDRLLKRAEAIEQSRAELKSQLLHAAKLVSVGELAAGVAHEINNPLAIIAAEAGLIKDMLDPQFNLDSSPDQIVEQLNHIETAVYRARGITQKLLNFSRKTEPKLSRSDVNRLLDEVVGGLKEREFQVANIRLVRDFDTDLPQTWMDQDQMRQVFLNLINNAGDAIEGAGTITLHTGHGEGVVRVTVTDTGKGMTSEQMAKLFTPFFTTKEVGKGTGLGLAISLSIVEGLGGRIEVQSMPGAGSSFTVVLPINLTEEQTDV